MSAPYAYFCFDPRDGEVFYVGKGRGKRAFRHVDGRSQNALVARRIAKLKDAGFVPVVELLPAATDEAAFALEHRLVAMFGRHDKGAGTLLNRTDGGDGPKGRVFTAEEKAAIAARLKGRPVSAATREKLSATNKAKVDDAYRAAVSERLRGHEVTAETRAKIGAAGRGRRQSPESIAKRAAAHRGQKRSEETKARMRLAQREAWRRRRGEA